MTIPYANRISREEFIRQYCEASGTTWEELRQFREAVPCDCGNEVCEGWAMMPCNRAAMDEAEKGRK